MIKVKAGIAGETGRTGVEVLWPLGRRPEVLQMAAVVP